MQGRCEAKETHLATRTKVWVGNQMGGENADREKRMGRWWFGGFGGGDARWCRSTARRINWGGRQKANQNAPEAWVAKAGAKLFFRLAGEGRRRGAEGAMRRVGVGAHSLINKFFTDYCTVRACVILASLASAPPGSANPQQLHSHASTTHLPHSCATRYSPGSWIPPLCKAPKIPHRC